MLGGVVLGGLWCATAADADPANDASCIGAGGQALQTEVLRSVNALRAAGAVCGAVAFAPAGPLRWNLQLQQAANGHSTDMAKNNYFSHTSPDGADMSQRAQASQYRYSDLGENIAAGQSSAAAAIAVWVNSAGHCQNLMNPAYRDVAMACGHNESSRFRYYWTMTLGRSWGVAGADNARD